jgi:hypothetical protein
VCGVPWIPPEESAWKAAQQTNATAYMPPSEVQSYSAVYYFLDQAFNQQIVANSSLSSACGFVLIDPDPTHFTPAQIDETIARTAGIQVETSKWVPYLATLRFNLSRFQGWTNTERVQRLPQPRQRDRASQRGNDYP